MVGAETDCSEAWRIIEAHPSVRPEFRHDTVEGLAYLYAVWAKADPSKAALAAEWKQRLDELNRAPKP